MKKTTAVTIFDNTDGAFYDIARESLEDEGQKPDDSAIWDLASDIEREDWDLVKTALVQFFGERPVVFAATMQLWDGIHRGGRIGKFEQLLDSFLSGIDSFSITDEDGHFHISAVHHDGCNSAEVMLIDKEGIDKVYEKFDVDLDAEEICDQEIHDFLEQEQALKPPYFAKIEYGTQTA